MRFIAGCLFSRDIQTVYERLTPPVWLSHGVRGDFTDYRGRVLGACLGAALVVLIDKVLREGIPITRIVEVAGIRMEVQAYAQLAQKNNTMIVPGNMTEVSALIGTAMALMKKG